MLNSLNVYNFPIIQRILLILVSKFMFHRDLSDRTYLSLGLLSPLTDIHCLQILFENTPFCQRLYEFYLSIKDFEILDKFNLLVNHYLCTQKSAESLLYNFHHEHILLKL